MAISFAHFRMFALPCCGQLLCWVNPRLPNYCPECGKFVFDQIKSCVTIADPQARIYYADYGTD